MTTTKLFRTLLALLACSLFIPNLRSEGSSTGRKEILHIATKADNWRQISYLYDMSIAEIGSLNGWEQLDPLEVPSAHIKVFAPSVEKMKVWEVAVNTSHSFYARERSIEGLIDRINREIYIKLAQLDKFKVKKVVAESQASEHAEFFGNEVERLESQVLEDRRELTAAKMYLLYIQEYKEQIANASRVKEGFEPKPEVPRPPHKAPPTGKRGLSAHIAQKPVPDKQIRKSAPAPESVPAPVPEEGIRIIPVRDYAEDVVRGLVSQSDRMNKRVLVPKPQFLGPSYSRKSEYILNPNDTAKPSMSYDQGLLDSLFNHYYRNYAFEPQQELPDVSAKLKMIGELVPPHKKARYYDLSDETGYRILLVYALDDYLETRTDSFVYRIIESTAAIQSQADSEVDIRNPFRFRPAQLDNGFDLASFFAIDPEAVVAEAEPKKKSRKSKKTDAEIVTEVLQDSTLVLQQELAEVNVVDEKKKDDAVIDTVDKQKAAYYLQRAKDAIDKSDAGKAQKFISKSLDIWPEYLEAHVMQADMHALFDRYEQALESYNIALVLDPGMAQLYYNRANCHYKLGKVESARMDFDLAISQDRNYILAYAGRASILVNESRFEDAIRDFDRIIELNKYFLPAYKGRGFTKLEVGDVDGAIADFGKYLEYEPDDHQIFYQRAMARINLGDYYNGCFDLLQSSRLGNSEARKAMKKYCN